jgi:Mg/Co/Ni transporter MgtE
VSCELDATVGDVRGLVEQSPYGFALVVARGGCLLGRLRKRTLEGDPNARAGDVMEAGPSTVRPDTGAGKLLRRLEQRDLRTAIVTTPEGELLGVVRRDDLPPEAGSV